MVSVPEGFEYPPEPETITERIAYALCAHDAFHGEGRLEPDELRVLEAIAQKIASTYGSPRSLNQWLGFGGADAFSKFRRFLMDERGLHTPARDKGMAIYASHIARCDWPSYMKAAKAAYSVMIERPEAYDRVDQTRLD